MGDDIVRTPMTRVFTIEDRAGPGRVPLYQGQARAMGPSWAFGDRTPIRKPDPARYNGFIIIDAIKGERGLPSMSLEKRYDFDISELLQIARRGCPMDIQVHMGKCQNPSDFNGGWDKTVILEGADISNWAAGELGALNQSEDAVINETIDTNALDLYEVLRLNFTELAEAQAVQEVVDIAICDSVTCGVCGIASTGCQRFFAVTKSHGASPGLPAELIYSSDGGATIGQRSITTLAANEDPSALACAGTYLAIVSNESGSIHYAPIADILAGSEVWAEVATGLVVPAGRPNDIFSAGSGHTWIVGNGGYIYFASDITAGVTPQTAGSVTVENLNAIHGLDDRNLVAVGANNAVLRTANGGATWTGLTGPAVGVDLNTVWMRTDSEWFVGAANGNLYYTRDYGATWTTVAFSGAGGGQVRDIVFATPSVGYMAHDTAAVAGRILRTIDGGNSWYVLPEGTGAIVANDQINALAACGEDPNIVYGGGLADDASDGIVVKAA